MSRSRAFRPAGVVGLWLVAVGLGVAAQPPGAVWPLAFAMLAPLALFAERASPRAVFGFVYLYQVAMGLVIVRWLLHALSVEYGVSPLAGWTFVALLVGAYAAIAAAAASAYAALRSRVRASTAPIVFACLWTLGEWVRGVPLALPWVLAAHPLAFVPAAIQTADLGGLWLPGFGVAWAGASVGVALAQRSARPLVGVALAAGVAAGYAAWRMPGTDADPSLRVGVIQASIPQRERFQPGSALENTRRHMALTRELAGRERLDLVVWSETAVDEDLDQVPGLVEELQALADRAQVPLVTGAPRSVGRSRRNSVVLLRPGARTLAIYDKQRLVPFSESQPASLAWLEPLLTPLVEGDPYDPGLASTLLPAPGARLATPVCFEITDPGLLRGFHQGGAELVLNLSNDAWFGRTGFAESHLAHVPFRAVEARTWVVRATNTGISAVIDPAGRVVSRLGLFEEGSLVAEVGLGGDPTVYTRFGDGPVLAALLVGLFAVLWIDAGPRGQPPSGGASPGS